MTENKNFGHLKKQTTDGHLWLVIGYGQSIPKTHMMVLYGWLFFHMAS